MYDVDNKYSFANATITFNSAWNWTSVSGTNDDGSHSVTAKTIASAFDTLLWFETPLQSQFQLNRSFGARGQVRK